ncbi:MAG: SMP-30/gluconolactonase/LRE family protein [Burkholderiaceae bacterium]
MRFLIRLFLFIALLAAALAATLYLRYGGTQPYPDVSTTPLIEASALEKVFEYPEPLGNGAVAADGRVFFTIHPESKPTGHKLLVWDKGTFKPFPNDAAQKDFDAILGVNIDAQGTLWTIDHGEHGLRTARLMAFDINKGEKIFALPFDKSIAPLGSMLQAMQVDSKGEFVYIADVSFWRKSPGIVVVDVKNKRAWRALDKHPSVMPQSWLIRTATKNMEFFGGLLALKPGIDGVALSKDDQTLYYAAMAHSTLFRISTAALKTPEAAANAADAVQALGPKPLNDGLSIDNEGNVFLTDVEHGGVMRYSKDGKLQTMIRDDKRIRWADSLSFGPDGYLYITDSAIPDQMLQSKAHMQARAPYFMYRFKPGTVGTPGQ